MWKAFKGTFGVIGALIVIVVGVILVCVVLGAVFANIGAG